MNTDILFAVIVPFFFICFGLLWIGFATYDFIKKKIK